MDFLKKKKKKKLSQTKPNPAAELLTVWQGKANFADRICTNLLSCFWPKPAFFGLVNPKKAGKPL
jgi:hypothetical protein